MILIDSSLWIEALREQGRSDLRQRVQQLILAGEACWMPLVKLELWNGARGEREKRALREFEQTLPELEVTSEVWTLAMELARQARAAGLTVPATDLLIFACARHHDVPVEAVDTHFFELAKLGNKAT